MRKLHLLPVLFALLFSASAFSQVQGIYRETFSKSYKEELNKNYPAAIALMLSAYDEAKYEVNLRLGWLYYMNKNYKESEKYYSRAVSLKKNSMEAKQGVILPLTAMERWDDVLQQYKDMLAIDPMNVTANYWAGVIYYNRKKNEEAAKHFEKVVQQHPFGYDGNHMLGWTYLNLGKPAEAKQYFTMALLISPEDPSSLSGFNKVK